MSAATAEVETALLTLPGINPPNFKNRTLWTADNLVVMRGMNSETVDLIYLDPPFNSKRDYAAPIGSEAAGAAFTDTWSLDDIKEEQAEELQASAPEIWHTIVGAGYTAGDSMQAYLTYMSIRLIEMHRILKPTASIYLHCDPTASHYLKQLMDAVFGKENFLNEIVWTYGLGGSSKRFYSRKHDIILFYCKKPNVYYFDKPQEPATSQLLKGKMKGLKDVWDIPSLNNMSTERTGYPTQKPLALLERIVAASSDENGMVFDPFCGCATTCVAAERLGREWVGCDIEPLARDLVVERLQKNDDEMPLFKLNSVGVPELPDIIYEDVLGGKGKLPKRTDPNAPRRSKNIKQVLYHRQQGCCVGKCGGRQFPIDIFEIDHIVPRSKGGADVDDNLQLLCPTCNSSKGNRAMSKWLRSG